MYKDYKRLTRRDLVGTYINQYEFANEVKKWQDRHGLYDYMGADATQILLERLADLEDKIENGTLIALPCKAGTNVYFVVDYPAYFKPIEETIVNGVTQFIENGIIHNQITTTSCLCFNYERDLGRTLFLTKAEAEARLRELKEKC